MLPLTNYNFIEILLQFARVPTMTVYSQETETVPSICPAPLMKSVLTTKTWTVSLTYQRCLSER